MASAAAELTVTAEPTLLDVAREVYRKSVDYDDAVAKLARRIRRDERLYEAVVRSAAEDMIGRVQHETRKRIARGDAAAPATYDPEKFVRIAGTVNRIFLDWPMMDGTKLGKADREHCLSDATRYHLNARGNLRNARFLEKVAGKLRPGQAVEDVLDDRRLAALMKKAAREAGDED